MQQNVIGTTMRISTTNTSEPCLFPTQSPLALNPHVINYSDRPLPMDFSARVTHGGTMETMHYGDGDIKEVN